MGTRGVVGVIINEQEKIGYNHFDSYPEELGVEVLAFLKGVDRHWLREKAEKLTVVSDAVPATPEQILKLRKYSNFHVNQYSMAGPPGGELPTEDVEWYNLLRETQGDLGKILDCGYVEDHSLFPTSSLFCEWGYIVDLDANKLEVYVGFQKRLPTKGRWAGRPTAEEDAADHANHLAYCAEVGRDPWMPPVSEYKACERIGLYSLNKLPDETAFVRRLNRKARSED